MGGNEKACNQHPRKDEPHEETTTQTITKEPRVSEQANNYET
jgi:hypothetical protein